MDTKKTMQRSKHEEHSREINITIILTKIISDSIHITCKLLESLKEPTTTGILQFSLLKY